MTGNGPSLGSTRGDGYIDQLIQIQIRRSKKVKSIFSLFLNEFFDLSIFVFVKEENFSEIFSFKSRTISTSDRQRMIQMPKLCPGGKDVQACNSG